jgi:hypothetical protein
VSKFSLEGAAPELLTSRLRIAGFLDPPYKAKSPQKSIL